MSVEVSGNRTPVLHLDWFVLIGSKTWLQFAKLPIERRINEHASSAERYLLFRIQNDSLSNKSLVCVANDQDYRTEARNYVVDKEGLLLSVIKCTWQNLRSRTFRTVVLHQLQMHARLIQNWDYLCIPSCPWSQWNFLCRREESRWCCLSSGWRLLVGGMGGWRVWSGVYTAPGIPSPSPVAVVQSGCPIFGLWPQCWLWSHWLVVGVVVVQSLGQARVPLFLVLLGVRDKSEITI